jgi:hypothetical protein
MAERLGVAKSSVERVDSRHPAHGGAARAAATSEPEHARRGDPLHLLGCMLYWAEGSKRRNCLVLVNTDVEMHRAFFRFLRECCGVADERITLRVNCHLNNGLSLDEIEAWWLAQLRLPSTSLRSATVNRPSSASRWRRNVYVYGTAAVRVDSTFLVQSIYGAIQEYGGFERPEWLD